MKEWTFIIEAVNSNGEPIEAQAVVRGLQTELEARRHIIHETISQGTHIRKIRSATYEDNESYQQE